MRAPACSEHGRLVLDLARGLLDDEQAATAERVRRECASCREWWTRTFEGEGYSVVEAAVGEGLETARLSSGHEWQAWLAAAAALVLVAVGVVWQLGQGPGPSVRAGDSEAGDAWSVQAPQQAIFVDDMESGDLGGWTVHAANPAPPVFQDDMETGDLSAWSS